ncbi:hypothetical protein BD779DRAFT_1673151 [Infundibulicybe gibba]|nr:hypothetical protein BD779DRAFT_1673151 [Infundibulicybe gibba]
MGGCLSREHSFHPDKDLLDLTGKVVVVTGGNTGIGYETVKQLARRGAKVYLGGVEQAILDNIVWLKVDYSDPRWARAAAKDFLTRETRLDILINNAAQLTGPFEKTKDVDGCKVRYGHVSTFVKKSDGELHKSHFSPVVFTATLLPLMQKTAMEPCSDVRIVTLASMAHRRVRAAADDIQFRTLEDYNGEFPRTFIQNAVTKLANILWSRKLQQQLDAQGIPITCVSVHPGEVNTFAARTPFPMLAGVLMAIFFLSVEAGAHNPCFAAASPEMKHNPKKYQGKYMEPVGAVVDPSPNAMRDDLADELWASTGKILQDLGILQTLGIN